MPFHIDRPVPIPMEDELVHTDHDPLCSDPKCPCKEDAALLAEVALAVENGLLTAEEATNLVKGKAL